MAKAVACIAALLRASDGLRRGTRKVELDVAKYQPICDDALVSHTCAAFAGESGRESVTVKEIAESLFATVASVETFLQELNLDGPTVSCKALCMQTAESLPAELIPPASQVGCRLQGSAMICHDDLTEQGLAAVAQTADHDRTPRANSSDDFAVIGKQPEWVVQEPRDVDFSDLQEDVAHWFGIWLALEEAPPSAQDSLAENTWPKCGPRYPTGCDGVGGAPDQAEIDRITLAYLTETQQAVRRGCNNLIEKWFGTSSSSWRRTLTNGLQIMTDMIRQPPHYVNWLSYQNYFGWVFPGERMPDGRLAIHFGGVYFRTSRANQIGTVTHEATHHPDLWTTDFIYCRVPPTACLDFARSRPRDAQRNADHWSFFIDDLVGGGMIGGSTPCSR